MAKLQGCRFERGTGGALHLNDVTDTGNGQTKMMDILADKYPPGQCAHPEVIINDDPHDVHPVIFKSLDAAMIRSAALHTSGAADLQVLMHMDGEGHLTPFTKEAEECFSLPFKCEICK